MTPVRGGPNGGRENSPRGASLRALGLPRALQVEADAHMRPVAVLRASHRGASGDRLRVERIEDSWRVAEAWWRAGAQTRTYYRVVLDGGIPLTFFHDDTFYDDTPGGWFEQPYSEPARPTGITRRPR